MKPYSLLLVVFYYYTANANCLLQKVSIDQRTKSSQQIINGIVKDQKSFWNFDKTSIYTVNTVEVFDYLKGNTPKIIEVIIPGGEIDGKLLVVEPNAELSIGSQGIFFLKDNTTALNNASKVKKYEIFSLAQGFIEQDQSTQTYKDPFEEYQNINTVASLISKTTGVNYTFSNTTSIRITNNSTANSGGTPITLSPTTISAGTGSELTINGRGFGSRTGIATIQFRDANSTSYTTYSNIPDSTYIISWTDTEIKVIVPGASINRQGGAGSGIVNIIHSSGAIIPSTNPINISYNQFEYKKRRVSLINQNSSGGYTFTLNAGLNSNTNAKGSFLRALDQWKCKTGVNININVNTTTNSCSNQIDNINTISFADASCQMPSGTLGVTYSTYSLCTGSPVIPDGIDMIFNNASNFYFGIDVTPSGLYDFESVVLHELGHAFGEGHHSDVAEIMFPSIANGISKRILNPYSDIESILEIVTRSSNSTNNCGYAKFIPLITNCTAQASNNITASFISDKTVGCAPLTVSFTDKSLGTPTQWRWDIDNNGSTDYTSQNISHTFTTPGTYNVKLIAINALNKDSIVQNAQIIVAPKLTANVNVGQLISCNNGSNGSLIATTTGGNGTYTYTWNNNQTSATATSLKAANYTVTVKDGYNCATTATKIITQPEPIQVGIVTESINANLFNAVVEVSGGVAPYNYVLNNNLITLINSKLMNLSSGNYSMIIKDKNNCIQNSSFSVSAPTALIDVEKSIDALDIYPNPATSNVNINLSLKEYQDVYVSLYNLSGQSVYEEKFNNIRDKQSNIDLSNLSSGTYILKFGLAEGNAFRKIIVNR